MEWSIQEIARLTGTTSRTLRYYGDIGLLRASRVGHGGLRHYDDRALVRLQRILLLRDLGLALSDIAAVLDRERSEEEALAAHLGWLRDEQDRLARRVASGEATLTTLTEGGELMAETMFDGFDHTVHRAEVVERWGAEADARSHEWWTSMDAGAASDWKDHATTLAQAWIDAAERGVPVDGPEAQALAERHVRWLTAIPGTPASTDGGDVAGYLRGLGDLYVADERFAAVYGGEGGARFVRDALHRYADLRL